MFPFHRNEKSKATELKEKVETIPEMGNRVHVERTLLSAAFDFE